MTDAELTDTCRQCGGPMGTGSYWPDMCEACAYGPDEDEEIPDPPATEANDG